MQSIMMFAWMIAAMMITRQSIVESNSIDENGGMCAIKDISEQCVIDLFGHVVLPRS